MACSQSTGEPEMGLSRAVTNRFVFGEDHCVLRVDRGSGSKGRWGEVGEETVVTVQARGEGGRAGDTDMEQRRRTCSTIDQMWGGSGGGWGRGQ